MAYEIVSREPFVIRIDGVRHKAFPPSGEAVLQFWRAIHAAKGNTSLERIALSRLLLRIFPLTWAILWLGNPVRKVLRMPLAEQAALLRDFCSSLGDPSPSRGTTTTGLTRIPNASAFAG